MNHQMEPHIHLSHTISVCMTEKDFLRRVKMTPPDMTALLHSGEAELLGKTLLADTDARADFAPKR